MATIDIVEQILEIDFFRAKIATYEKEIDNLKKIVFQREEQRDRIMLQISHSATDEQILFIMNGELEKMRQQMTGQIK